MIGKLTGVVDSSGEDWAIIDVSGVGYVVSCSGRTLSRLSRGDAASLLIETHVREDAIQLFGFVEAAERDWFRMLTTVQGVGAKVALAILTVLGPDVLAPAIAAADTAALTQAPGVGRKLATRILSELKDKVADIGPGVVAEFAAGAAAGGPTADAVSALVNLGYSRSEAFGAVSRAAVDLGGEAAAESLIRAALTRLAPRELSA